MCGVQNAHDSRTNNEQEGGGDGRRPKTGESGTGCCRGVAKMCGEASAVGVIHARYAGPRMALMSIRDRGMAEEDGLDG